MANRMNRREFLLASALLAAATQAPAAQVKRGGKLRYATDADVLHLAPWVAMTQSHIFYTVYDTLVVRDLKGQLTPGLAKSWKFSQDGRSLTFDLQVDAYLFGFGEVWEAPLPEGSIGYAPDLKGKIGTDLNKAKRLIAEGGYPNGFESTVMIGPDSRAPGMPMMAEILQADLKKIGVNLKIEQVEAQVCSDRWSAGKYDMSIHSYGRIKEPGELFQAMVWRKENPEQFRAPEYGKLIDEGMATLDEKKKQEIYHRLYEIILDECFCIPVAAVPRTIAYRKSVMNFDWSADGYIRAENMWLEKA